MPTARELNLLDLTKRILNNFTKESYELMKELHVIEIQIMEEVDGEYKESNKPKLDVKGTVKEQVTHKETESDPLDEPLPPDDIDDLPF